MLHTASLGRRHPSYLPCSPLINLAATDTLLPSTPLDWNALTLNTHASHRILGPPPPLLPPLNPIYKSGRSWHPPSFHTTIAYREIQLNSFSSPLPGNSATILCPHPLPLIQFTRVWVYKQWGSWQNLTTGLSIHGRPNDGHGINRLNTRNQVCFTMPLLFITLQYMHVRAKFEVVDLVLVEKLLSPNQIHHLFSLESTW